MIVPVRGANVSVTESPVWKVAPAGGLWSYTRPGATPSLGSSFGTTVKPSAASCSWAASMDMFTTDGRAASLPPPMKRTANTMMASNAIASTAPPNTMVAGFFASTMSTLSSYGGNTTTGISAVSDKFLVTAGPRASVSASVSTPSRMRRISSRTSMALS